jgi:hypothetical protein
MRDSLVEVSSVFFAALHRFARPGSLTLPEQSSCAKSPEDREPQRQSAVL